MWEENEDTTSISSLNLVLNALMAVSHVGFCVKFSVTFNHSGDFSESGQGSYLMQTRDRQVCNRIKRGFE